MIERRNALAFALTTAVLAVLVCVGTRASARPLEAGANAVSRGRIYYHLTPPVASTAGLFEYLDLAGDRYTDLAMSNYVAGVILGAAVQDEFPGVGFDKDYLYGMTFGQLLQENIETALYRPSSTLIDSSPLQAAVMGVGQGGPYQLNDYDVDLAKGGYTPQGYALLNYTLIQAGMGFTFAQAPSQFSKPTPPSFNDTSFAPVLATFFHVNDLRSLRELEAEGYTPVPDFDRCFANLRGVANAPVDVLLSYAYNQGFYGGLLTQATALCAKNVPAFVAAANDYANAQGGSFNAYPYQVRFYLDELYNRSTLRPPTSNHLFFNMRALGLVFERVFDGLSYVDPAGRYVPIPPGLAGSAYSGALQRLRIAPRQGLDVGDATQRATIFAVLEDAVARVQAATGRPLSQTTQVQL